MLPPLASNPPAIGEALDLLTWNAVYQAERAREWLSLEPGGYRYFYHAFCAETLSTEISRLRH